MSRIFKVALKLKTLTGPQLALLAVNIYNMMTGNSSVPTPEPPLTKVQSDTQDYVAAKNELEAAKSTLKEKASNEKQKRKILELTLTAEGRYVDTVAVGNKTIIESCGMPASDDPAPVHLGQVEDLSLTRGDNPGSVDAHWHSMSEALNYTIETSLTAPDEHGVAAWVFYGNSSKSTATVSGFTSGINIWVHVCANGSGQSKGAFSDPAMLIVP